MTDYLNLLDHSFSVVREIEGDNAPSDRSEYLSEYIFDFTTYDGSMSALFGGKAIEVCAAINDGTTFKYIKDTENYRWFLLMCNMPFFAPRLEWGTSIRGAWWAFRQPPLKSCGLWITYEQIIEPLRFDNGQWKAFIAAMIAFAKIDAGLS